MFGEVNVWQIVESKLTHHTHTKHNTYAHIHQRMRTLTQHPMAHMYANTNTQHMHCMHTRYACMCVCVRACTCVCMCVLCVRCVYIFMIYSPQIIAIGSVLQL